MTKLRQPATFADAVTRIAGVLTWSGMADVVGKAERTVRNWSDPETNTLPTVEDAMRLDAAFVAQAGGAPPILSVYGFRLEQVIRPAPDAAAIAAVTGSAAIEGGQAIKALVDASQPGAPRAARIVARRECLEASETFAKAAHQLGEEE